MAENLIQHPVISALLQQFIKKTEKAFQSAVEREGLISSGELLNSIRAESVQTGSDFISAHVSYSDLLRIKDMKALEYSTIPPIAPLVDWVERVGLSKFPYVPGYPNGVGSASETEQIYRIAAGLQYHLKAFPSVRRGYRGIYNDNLKYTLLPSFYEDMRAAVTAAAKQSFFNAFGYDTHVDIPSGEINASRIQAAWNAQDTKVARKYANPSTTK